MFIVLSGVSASGKNTIINELVKRKKNIKVLEQSSGTTRPPRPSDKDNHTYLFMTNEEFEKGINDGKFIEHELVHGNYYGLLREKMDKVIKDNQFDYIRDIDVNGNISLKKYFAGKCKMLSIFIDAPDDVLRLRLKNRGDSEESIEKRLSRGEYERARKGDYDLVIENIDIEKTLKEIIDTIDNYKNK